MSKSTKAFLYNFLGFASTFLPVYFLLQAFTGLSGWWIPATSFVACTILSPKFQAATIHGEEKIFMRWLFLKGVKVVG
jgi:hypothetical protein